MVCASKTILTITATVGVILILISVSVFFVFPELVAKKVKQVRTSESTRHGGCSSGD